MARDFEELQEEFSDLFEDLDMTPLYSEIGEIMLGSIEKNFAQQGRVGGLKSGEYAGGGSRWNPLKPSTIKQRQRQGYWPGKILQVRGRLASSFTKRVRADGTNIGTNVSYAPFLHYGTTRMAARPILVVQDEDMEEIEAATYEFLSEQLSR